MVRVNAAVPESSVENRTKKASGIKNHLAQLPRIVVNIFNKVWIMSPPGGGYNPRV